MRVAVEGAACPTTHSADLAGKGHVELAGKEPSGRNARHSYLALVYVERRELFHIRSRADGHEDRAKQEEFHVDDDQVCTADTTLCEALDRLVALRSKSLLK